MPTPPRPRTSALKPETTLAALAEHWTLDDLTGPQLVVFVRLVAATGTQRRRAVSLANHELYKHPRTAVRVLGELQDKGLVRVKFAAGSYLGRTIEVL